MSWSTAKLSSLTNRISSGSTPKGGSDNYLADGPIMFIRSQNVHMNALILDDVAYISEELHQKMKRTWVHPGDVLLNITGASIGRVTPFDLENTEANVNQHVCIIRPRSNLLFAPYLSYYLSTPRFQNHIDEMQHGGTRQALNFSQIGSFEIPLPPLPEQQRIAAILDKADALRAKRRATLAKLDTLLQATFLDMFGDPVTNPMGWEEAKLEDLVKAKRPITYGVLKPGEYTPNGIPMLRIQDIYDSRISATDLHLISHRLSEQYKRTILNGGELVISLVGTLGLVAIVPNILAGANIHRNLGVIAANDKVSVYYLHSLMCLPQFEYFIDRVTKGGIQKLLNLSDLRAMQIPLPPLEIQYKYFERLKSVEKSRYRLESSAKGFDNLFHALQQRAFKGEL